MNTYLQCWLSSLALLVALAMALMWLAVCLTQVLVLAQTMRMQQRPHPQSSWLRAMAWIQVTVCLTPRTRQLQQVCCTHEPSCHPVDFFIYEAHTGCSRCITTCSAKGIAPTSVRSVAVQVPKVCTNLIYIPISCPCYHISFVLAGGRVAAPSVPDDSIKLLRKRQPLTETNKENIIPRKTRARAKQ